MRTKTMRRILAVGAAVALCITLGSCRTTGQDTSNTSPVTTAAAEVTTPYPTVVAAGDIACDPAHQYFNGGSAQWCKDRETANRVRAINPYKVIALGDLQYEDATLSKFQQSYGRSWGQSDIKTRTYPVVGNHEYKTANAQGYRDYFGNPGDSDLAYSKTIGGWRVFFLNSNCAELDKAGVSGSCAGQVSWMKETMTNSPTKCSIAAFHHPRRTDVANHYPGTTTVAGIEQAFYDKRGEIILNGHAHSIEISNKITPSGANSDRGVKHFTIGSGGKENLKPWQSATKPGWTDYRNNGEHAVLKLTLKPTSYDYAVVDIDGNTLRSGTRNCF